MTSMLLFRLLVFICIAVSPCPTVAFVVGPTPRSLVCPLQASSSSSSSSSPSTTEYDTAIDEAKAVLNRAAETKREDPELVMNALQDLEKLMRQKAKADPKTAEQMLSSLNGNWRLVFTTGTKDTQKKIQGKINYFPLKAVQSFDTTQDPMIITNGIYLGEEWTIVKFFGTFDFDLRKRKLEFDFDELSLFGLVRIPLAAGQAAQIGASSGLGSESNVENAKRKRQAFFNWISADDTIATARGGGGGLALWKRT